MSQVLPPTPAKPIDYIAPRQADEAGMRKWVNDMLSGHPVVVQHLLSSGVIHMLPSSRLFSTR